MAEREGFAHYLTNSRWLLRRLPYAHCREPLGPLICHWQRSLRFESLESVISKIKLAEREGFEPSVPFSTHDFQSCTFGRSVTSPQNRQNTPKNARL